MEKTLLEKIERIESMKKACEHQYFNAGVIDRIFSKVNRVRKETPDGKEFECEYSFYDGSCDWMTIKAIIKNCGVIFQPTSHICPITNKPMNVKVKQYYVSELQFADGINKHIAKLERNLEYLNNMETICNYKEFLVDRILNYTLGYGYVNCESTRELKQYLVNNLLDSDITFNEENVLQLFKDKKISLRLARYLNRHISNRYNNHDYEHKELVFKYEDLTSKYENCIQRNQETNAFRLKRIAELQNEVAEWKEIRKLYS